MPFEIDFVLVTMIVKISLLEKNVFSGFLIFAAVEEYGSSRKGLICKICLRRV